MTLALCEQGGKQSNDGHIETSVYPINIWLIDSRPCHFQIVGRNRALYQLQTS